MFLFIFINATIPKFANETIFFNPSAPIFVEYIRIVQLMSTIVLCIDRVIPVYDDGDGLMAIFCQGHLLL